MCCGASVMQDASNREDMVTYVVAQVLHRICKCNMYVWMYNRQGSKLRNLTQLTGGLVALICYSSHKKSLVPIFGGYRQNATFFMHFRPSPTYQSSSMSVMKLMGKS